MQAARCMQLQVHYLGLGYAAMGSGGDAGRAVQHFSCCSSCGAAYADVRVVQKQRHMVTHKVEQPHGAKVEAAKCLQGQPSQRSTLELACTQQQL